MVVVYDCRLRYSGGLVDIESIGILIKFIKE